MRPLTAWLAEDGTVFLPVGYATDVCFFQGHDKAYKACIEHEAEAKQRIERIRHEFS